MKRTANQLCENNLVINRTENESNIPKWELQNFVCGCSGRHEQASE